MTAQPILLADFFTEHLAPLLPNKNNRKAHRHCIINVFGTFLGCDPKLAHLTVPNVEAFSIWMERRFKPPSAATTLCRLYRIWKLAYSLGLASVRPPDRHPGRAKDGRVRLWEVVPQQLDKREVTLLRDFVVHFYIPLSGDIATNTVRLYEASIRNFENYLGRPSLLTDLGDESLARFLASRLVSGASPCTANRELFKLLAFGRLAYRKRMLDEWPRVVLAREPRREPMAWLQAELDQLWNAFAAIEGTIAGVPARLWWRAAHEVLWWSGERISSVLALRIADVDLASGWMLFRAESRKGRTGDIRRRLGPSGIVAVKDILEPTREFVLPWDRSTGVLWSHYKTILKSAGLPYGRLSMFHRMRKSAASHYTAAGGDASRLLDHSSPKVTRAYLDQRIATVAQPADLLFAPGESEVKHD